MMDGPKMETLPSVIDLAPKLTTAVALGHSSDQETYEIKMHKCFKMFVLKLKFTS